MATQCETPDYTDGPCHCDFCDPGRLREDRIETIYQSWGAREMAERIVELEDELGADVDGVCTGMHADVAEAHDEIERLQRALRISEAKVGGAALYVDRVDARSTMLENAVAAYGGIHEERDRYKAAWKSARRRAKTARGAWRAAQHISESWHRMFRRESDLTRNLLALVVERTQERDRYRLAWLSARRRAADEANFGMEALDREREKTARYGCTLIQQGEALCTTLDALAKMTAERDRWRASPETAEAQLVRERRDNARLRAFADEVRLILGWTHVDGNWRGTHMPSLYDARHELDSAEREGRAFATNVERRAARGDFDEDYPVEADDVRKTTHGSPRLECAGVDEFGEVWRLAPEVT